MLHPLHPKKLPSASQTLLSIWKNVTLTLNQSICFPIYSRGLGIWAFDFSQLEDFKEQSGFHWTNMIFD